MPGTEILASSHLSSTNTYYNYSDLTDGKIEGINYLPKVTWQNWKSDEGQSDSSAWVMQCHTKASSLFMLLCIDLTVL